MAQPEWTTRLVDAPLADLLTKPEVVKLFGISEDTLNRLIDDGEFPEAIKMTKKTQLWDWRSVAYYRLRLEMLARLGPKSTAMRGSSDADGG